MRIPFLLVGDSPRNPSGLGRIARDLSAHLCEMPELDFLQLGWEGLEADTLLQPAWRYMPFTDRNEDWGASVVARTYQRVWGNRPGVVLTVWDPARCAEYASLMGGSVRFWGYFAIDGHTARGDFGGPAAAVVRKYDRVLAYGKYGLGILQKTAPDQKGSYLPHGLDLDTWSTEVSEDDDGRVAGWFPADRARHVIGCVATNQPRKDLWLFFATLRELLDRGEKVHGWLHTDTLHTPAWSVPALVEYFDLKRYISLTTPEVVSGDMTLAAAYQRCTVVMGVGRGEGFGYPTVEALAAGRVSLATDYAGSRDLLPPQWRVPYYGTRAEGGYLIERPQVDPKMYAAYVQGGLKAAEDPKTAQYCRLLVAHLGWRQLWPRWASWVRKGLEQI